ncbi:hypothetical protein T484DRAFT_1757332 [Baffinella frigidus]|nr:hypothetical protein T484DRAFT_1757332 [Cryptophyta sp. CCMP2293]
MEIIGDYEMSYRMSRMNHHGHYCGVCFEFMAHLRMMCCGFVMCATCHNQDIPCPMQRNECAKRGENGAISMMPTMHGSYVIYGPCKLKYEITEDMSLAIADRMIQDIFTSLTQSNVQNLIGLCQNLVCVGHVLFECVQSGVFTKEQFKGLVRLAEKLLPKVGVDLHPSASDILTEFHKEHVLSMASKRQTEIWNAAVDATGDTSGEDTTSDDEEAVLQNCINNTFILLRHRMRYKPYVNCIVECQTPNKDGLTDKYHNMEYDTTPEVAEARQALTKAQWQCMKCTNMTLFVKSKMWHDDPAKRCIVPIIDDINTHNVTAAYSLAALLAMSTKRAGSPWHWDGKSNVVYSHGFTANIAGITDSDNPVDAVAELFQIKQEEDEKANTTRKSNDSPDHIHGSLYTAMDLILQRAKEANVTAGQFSTWSLVFISDKDFSDLSHTDQMWQGDLWRPYQKIQQMMTEWMTEMHYDMKHGYPTLVFYRIDGEFDEQYCHGIPVEGDQHPGIILLSGCGDACVEEVIQICSLHIKPPRNQYIDVRVGNDTYSDAQLHHDDNRFEQLSARMPGTFTVPSNNSAAPNRFNH